MQEKSRKRLFWMILGIAFLTVYAYNFFTPYMSDDFTYALEAREAHSLWDLLKQQYAEYLSNSGRIIGQFNVRLSLLFDKQIFNVVNSGMFVTLTALIYANIRRKKKYDLFVLLLILTFLWKYSVHFGQTMLWICGSCNYLWGSVIILGFITLYRYFLEHADQAKHPILQAIGIFFFGILAGWCNENTSGGGFLILLLFVLNFWWNRRSTQKKAIFPFMLTGLIGMCCGMVGMVLAPGVKLRSTVMSEGAYTGIAGLASKLYKITMSVQNLFMPVLVILVITTVLLVLQKKLQGWKNFRSNETMIFLVASIATAYVLALAPTPMDRAFFGVGVFLFIACIQGITDITDQEIVIKTAKYSLVGILCLWLFFTYVGNLVNLYRIDREEKERIALIMEARDDINGDSSVVVPLHREAFENPYSDAHNADLSSESDYWINHFYQTYYQIGHVTAIPREEWDELYGEER